eukprot:1222327-Pyramimonas_sp.AAC.3
MSQLIGVPTNSHTSSLPTPLPCISLTKAFSTPTSRPSLTTPWHAVTGPVTLSRLMTHTSGFSDAEATPSSKGGKDDRKDEELYYGPAPLASSSLTRHLKHHRQVSPLECLNQCHLSISTTRP